MGITSTWFWEDDSKKWQPYNECVSLLIETAFLGGRCCNFTHGNYDYKIRTMKFQQVNCITKTKRIIKRVITEPNCCVTLAAAPPSLFLAGKRNHLVNPIVRQTADPMYQSFLSFEMDINDGKHLEALFLSKWTSDRGSDVDSVRDSMDAKRMVTVTKMERFINVAALQKYRANALTCTRPKEQLLFHGTSSTDYMTVAREGLDMRRADPQGTGMLYYGPAIYLSGSSAYSHKYAHRHGTTKDCVMLVVRCLVGNICDYGDEQRQNLKQPIHGYDSVRGIANGSEIYAIYNNAQCIVEAAVHYRCI